MTGGADADIFIYAAVNQSPSLARDIITDFAEGSDKINLSAIDANATNGGNQAFSFLAVDNAPFTAPGQVRYHYDAVTGNTLVEANLNGNFSTVEFAIVLTGQHLLSSTDFIL